MERGKHSLMCHKIMKKILTITIIIGLIVLGLFIANPLERIKLFKFEKRIAELENKTIELQQQIDYLWDCENGIGKCIYFK